MGVSFITSSEASINNSVTSFSWSLNPSIAPSGIVVFGFAASSSVNPLTSVTYGGVAMTEIVSAMAVDTAGESGRIRTWFLGSGIPSGSQTVVVNRANNSTNAYAIAFALAAKVDTEVYEPGIVVLQEDQVLTEQNVDDGSIGFNSLRVCGLYSGSTAPAPTVGANSTIAQFAVSGSRIFMACYETVPGMGSRPVGFDCVSDDVAAVHLAIRENYTFGNKVIGGSTFSGSADIGIALRAVAPENGVLNSISVYSGASNDSKNLKAILYTDAVSPLVIAIGDVTPGGVGAGWITSVFATPPQIVAGTTYYIGIVEDDGITGFAYSVGGAANQMKYGSLTYASPEATWASPSNFNWQIAMYGTYTLASGNTSNWFF